jgi:hypothetical protein
MRYFPPALVAVLLFCMAPASGWAQKLSCSPCNNNFGSLQVGNSSTAYIQLSNTASGTLTLSSASVQGAGFSVGNIPLPINLPFGTSIQLPVIFTPVTPGAHSATINLGSNAENSPLSINVSGNGTGNATAQLAASPAALSFGNVTVGSSATLQTTLTASNAAVTISSDQSTNSQFSVVGMTLPVTIGAGKSLAVTIKFTPSGAGSVSGKANFSSNAANSPSTVQLTGAGTTQSSRQLAASPTTLAFGNVTVGSSATLQTTLTASNAEVTISSDQSTNSQFSITGLSLPITIAAGKSLAVTIKFTPSGAGAVSGKASFTSNAQNSPATVQLSGTGVAAKSNPQLTVSPATLAFGNVTIASSATLQTTFTASNAAVTISSDQSSNSQFSITGLSLPVTIAAGNSLAVTIQYTPTTAGAASGKATFTSNAQNSPTTVSLTGTGVTSKANATLTVTPATLAFGNVTVGSSATLQAALAAKGGTVTISSDQSTSSEFSIVGLTLPLTVAAGNSVSVTIQFTPNASGAATGKAGFISNAANSPTVEQLTGTGVAQGSHSVDLTWDAGDGNAVGYNVYRGTSVSGPFTQINSALDSSTSYTDSTVVSGSTYYYVATEVNSQGQESAYSNVAKATVPSP